MKVAHIAPILDNIPNGTDGPTVACTNLHLGFLKLGVDATLFGFKNFRISGKLKYLFPKEFTHYDKYLNGNNVVRAQMTMAHYAYAFSKSENFDVYQTHLLQSTLFFAHFLKIPTVIKISNPVSSFFADMVREFNRPNLHFVAISKTQQKTLPRDIKNTSVIYESVNTDLMKPKYKKKDHALFVGRLVRRKRPHIAIDACIRAKQPLLVIGQVPPEDQKEDLLYFKKEIAKRLKHPLVRHISFVPRNKMNPYFQDAKCLIFPTDEKEPFGLVFIEALASGTPVVALKGGVASEIITKQVGLLGKTPAELPSLLKRVDVIDPKKCREYAEENFSYTNIAKKYLALYEKLIRG